MNIKAQVFVWTGFTTPWVNKSGIIRSCSRWMLKLIRGCQWFSKLVAPSFNPTGRIWCFQLSFILTNSGTISPSVLDTFKRCLMTLQWVLNFHFPQWLLEFTLFACAYLPSLYHLCSSVSSNIMLCLICFLLIEILYLLYNIWILY